MIEQQSGSWVPSLRLRHMVAVAIVVLIGGVGLTRLTSLIDTPPYEVRATDLERDLIGYAAVKDGAPSPYAPIGEFRPEHPARDLWVAHSPFSVALGGVFGEIVQLEPVRTFQQTQVLGYAVLIVLLLVTGWRSDPLLASMCGTSLLYTIAARDDITWAQGQSLVGCGILAALLIARSRKPWVAGLLTGLLIAVRPWLLPIAGALGTHRTIGRRLLVPAATSVAATLSALFLIGGVGSLWEFITEATPANEAQYNEFEWNLTLFASPSFLFPLAVAGGWFLLRGDRSERLRLWGAVLTVLLFAPFVWSHYLTALTPLIVFPILARDDHEAIGPVSAAVLVAPSAFLTVVVAGEPLRARIGWWLVAGLLILGIYDDLDRWTSRHVDRSPAETTAPDFRLDPSSS